MVGGIAGLQLLSRAHRPPQVTSLRGQGAKVPRYGAKKDKAKVTPLRVQGAKVRGHKTQKKFADIKWNRCLVAM